MGAPEQSEKIKVDEDLPIERTPDADTDPIQNLTQTTHPRTIPTGPHPHFHNDHSSPLTENQDSQLAPAGPEIIEPAVEWENSFLNPLSNMSEEDRQAHYLEYARDIFTQPHRWDNFNHILRPDISEEELIIEAKKLREENEASYKKTMAAKISSQRISSEDLNRLIHTQEEPLTFEPGIDDLRPLSSDPSEYQPLDKEPLVDEPTQASNISRKIIHYRPGSDSLVNPENRSSDQPEPDETQLSKLEFRQENGSGFMKKLGDKFSALIPLMGAFLVLSASRVEAGSATQILKRESGIPFAILSKLLSRFMPSKTSIRTIDGVKYMAFDNVQIKGFQNALSLYFSDPANKQKAGKWDIISRNKEQYAKFKETLKEQCSDINKQKQIIAIIAKDYLEKYGDPYQKSSSPKIGATDVDKATIDTITYDTEQLMRAINQIIRDFDEDHWRKIMDLALETLSDNTENAIILAAQSASNIISQEGNPQITNEDLDQDQEQKDDTKHSSVDHITDFASTKE